jgi:hypothetical protein
MAHIAHQPGPVCLEGGVRVSRWLVGVVGLGAELHQRPQAARGALLQYFNSSGLGKRAAPGPSAPGAEDLTGMAELRPLIPGGGQEEKSRCFATTHKQAVSHVQEENLSCARGQVITAGHRC